MTSQEKDSIIEVLRTLTSRTPWLCPRAMVILASCLIDVVRALPLKDDESETVEEEWR